MKARFRFRARRQRVCVHSSAANWEPPCPRKTIASLDTKIASQSSSYVEEALQWIPETNGKADVDQPVKKTKAHPYTILLADDNADMRKYVQRLFETEYNVIVAADGEEAFEKAVKYIPDLILSDIMMPKLDGFGLLKKLKTNISTRNIPLIFLSARAGEEAKVEGLRAGADDYLTKPFSSKELIARVANHLAISTARRHAEKEFFNLFLQSPAHIHVFKGPEQQSNFFIHWHIACRPRHYRNEDT